MVCKCATLDTDNGRWQCSISGSECMYLYPNQKRCAEEYGEVDYHPADNKEADNGR